MDTYNKKFLKYKTKYLLNKKGGSRDKYILGVAGGVGPMAGIGLQKLIISNTKANIDQDHFTVVHISASSLIDNRQTFLEKLHQGQVVPENPGKEMSKVAISISKASKKLGKPCLVGVVCNTFHAPPIFEVYRQIINSYNIKNNLHKSSIGYIRLVNLIEVTSQFIDNKGYKKIGIISANGTRLYRVYDHYLDPRIVIEYLNDKDQESLENDIFTIKKQSYANKKVIGNIEKHIKTLADKGIECIILGCSELPIAITSKRIFNIDVINPIEIMAKYMIKLSNPSKLIIR